MKNRDICGKSVLALLTAAFVCFLCLCVLEHADEYREFQRICDALKECRIKTGYAVEGSAGKLKAVCGREITVYGCRSESGRLYPENKKGGDYAEQEPGSKTAERVFLLLPRKDREALHSLCGTDHFYIIYQSERYLLYGFQNYKELASCVFGQQGQGGAEKRNVDFPQN